MGLRLPSLMLMEKKRGISDVDYIGTCDCIHFTHQSCWHAEILTVVSLLPTPFQIQAIMSGINHMDA